ncbi:hypothetical protein J4458_05340 [Candidatus Woesearchaeota archaeon]|nr:hypothetical protein [Candidatus Woesearchaeota archaeon]
MKNKILFYAMLFVLLMHLSSIVFAQEDDDLEIFGLEAEKLLNLGSGMLATALLIFTLAAYKRTKKERLVYVSAAFALFAVKGFLTSIELLSIDWSWVDPVASLLNFGILLAFFAGIIKK